MNEILARSIYTKWILFLVLFVLAAQFAFAGERERVAVPKFRNSTGKTLRISGSDMAAWMSSELKKTKKFEPIDFIQLNAITKNAKWSDDRYDQDVEAQIKEMPADYVLYGSIQVYRVENFISNDAPWRDEPQVPKIIVAFSIRIVDLKGNKQDQEIVVQGDALGDGSMGLGGPPYNENDSTLDSVFQNASKQAMRKATKNIAEHLQ